MKKIIPEDAVLIPTKAKQVFKGIIYDVYQWPQRLYDGTITTFEMVRRPDSVDAICVVDDKILLLDEVQPSRGRRRRFPGGRVDETDVSPLIAIKREILDETGYTFEHWRLIKVSQPRTKVEQFEYLYLAWDVAQIVDAQPDAGEKITVELLPLAEVKQLARYNVGYLGENKELLELQHSVQELLETPECKGKEIDR